VQPSGVGRQATSGSPPVLRGLPHRAADHFAEDSPALAIAVHHHTLPALVVEVAGELDILTAPRLLDALRALLRERSPVLVVDLSAVEFMGSAGLFVLAETHRDAGTHTSLRIVAPGRVTLRPLQVTGLDTVLNLYRSRPDALAAPADPSRQTRT
jgi:anti-sigma B factor antagonist